MAKYLVLISLLACSVLFSTPKTALTAEILGPEIEIRNNDILVNTGLIDIKDLISAINSGVEKEIVFTVDLFRVWKFWPDEFVVSKIIRRTIQFDNLRSRYSASANNGKTEIKKRFKDFRALRSWAFSVNELNLANIRELEAGSYYVRVVAESKSMELPPVIGLLMLFIPEVEMSLAKESHHFNIGDTR